MNREDIEGQPMSSEMNEVDSNAETISNKFPGNAQSMWCVVVSLCEKGSHHPEPGYHRV
jgi:hypothetical protein